MARVGYIRIYRKNAEAFSPAHAGRIIRNDALSADYRLPRQFDL